MAAPRQTPPLLLLFHHRWAVLILRELERTDGSKFVTLSLRLGIARDSLQRTLKALTRIGLVMRNPGVGHPLRPEYILTARGRKVAEASVPVIVLLEKLNLEAIGLKKWCMPVVAALSTGAKRFSELKAQFPNVTARALALALKDLESAKLITRSVVQSYPPTTRYELSRSGARFTGILQRLSKVSASR